MSKGKRFGELVKQIPVRLVDLLIKLVSVKGVALALISWALATDKIDGVMYLVAIGAILGIRALEKGIGGQAGLPQVSLPTMQISKGVLPDTYTTSASTDGNPTQGMTG